MGLTAEYRASFLSFSLSTADHFHGFHILSTSAPKAKCHMLFPLLCYYEVFCSPALFKSTTSLDSCLSPNRSLKASSRPDHYSAFSSIIYLAIRVNHQHKMHERLRFNSSVTFHQTTLARKKNYLSTCTVTSQKVQSIVAGF